MGLLLYDFTLRVIASVLNVANKSDAAVRAGPCPVPVSNCLRPLGRRVGADEEAACRPCYFRKRLVSFSKEPHIIPSEDAVSPLRVPVYPRVPQATDVEKPVLDLTRSLPC